MTAALAELEAEERAAFAAIGELGRRELDAVKVWVAGDCKGPRPQPDAAERDRLTRRLMRAMNARAEAERAL